MIKQRSTHLLLALVGTAIAAVGCSTASNSTTGTGGHTGTGTGGTIGGTGSGGSSTGGPGVALTPSPSGFVDAATNTLGVIGAWFAYGDGNNAAGVPGMGKCQMNGHTVCSTISAPTLPAGTAGFPPSSAGAMCTTGMVAPVSGTPPDFSNIFGAGIGLDLNNPGGANSVKGTFPATTKGVTGISFTLDVPPTAGLRVEFPTTDTDGTTSGAAYWGATASFPNSAVVAGVNTIHWADVKVPTTATTPTFNPNNLESIQFHVPAAGTTATAPVPYQFCISNLTMLTN